MKSLHNKELEEIKEPLCLILGREKTRHNDEAEYVSKLLKTSLCECLRFYMFLDKQHICQFLVLVILVDFFPYMAPLFMSVRKRDYTLQSEMIAAL